MQNLINSLNAGTTEYKDGGVIVQHPPTHTMRRAANTIAQLANINESNSVLILSLQQTINTQLELIEALQKDKQNAEIPGLHNVEQQTGDVVSGSGNAPTSDPVTEAGSSEACNNPGVN